VLILEKIFAAEEPIKRGVLVAPSVMTTTTLPEGEWGHILTFDVVAQRWKARPLKGKENLQDNPLE
jgi:hypothetical protein